MNGVSEDAKTTFVRVTHNSYGSRTVNRKDRQGSTERYLPDYRI